MSKTASLLLFNPLSGLLKGFHCSLLGGGMRSAPDSAYAPVTSLVVFAGGAIAFKRMERRFADVI